MLPILFASLFRSASGAADATSTITCTPSGGVVNVRSTWGSLCRVNPKQGGVATTAEFSVFGIAVSGSNGNVVNVNPPDGARNSFDFQISVKDATGIFDITNVLGIPTIPITVVDIQTNMTEMKCDTILNVSQQVNCTLTPRDSAGLQIWAEAHRFSMTGVDIGVNRGGSITWQAITPAVGNSFSVLGTFPYSSVFGITNGVTSQLAQVAAIDIPDGTTAMTCTPAIATTTLSPRCTINARKAGMPIITSKNAFHISGLNQNVYFGPVLPVGSPFVALGELFSFDIIVGNTAILLPFANTGVFPVSNNVSAQDFLMTVVADPDSSSTLSCASTQVVAGGPLHCNSVPKLQGTTIWSETAVFILSGVDNLGQSTPALGSFSTITPLAAGNLFNWTFTPSAIVPNQTFPFDITLNDGRSSHLVITVIAPQLPDHTSNLSCAPLNISLGDSTTCTIHANKNSLPIVAAGNAFTRTDGDNGGTFSPLTPTAGMVFSFTYTPAGRGTMNISDGRSSNTVMLVVSDAIVTPAPSMQPSAAPNTAPTAPTTAGSPTPAVTPTPKTPTAPTAKTPSISTPTPKTPTSPTAAGQPTPAVAPTAAQVNTGEQGDNGGLGAGGIVLIILALLLLGAGGFFFYRRQKKRKADHHFGLVEQDLGTYEPARI